MQRYAGLWLSNTHLMQKRKLTLQNDILYNVDTVVFAAERVLGLGQLLLGHFQTG